MPRACDGADGGPCLFNSARPGRPAQPVYGKRNCVFCNPSALEEWLARPGGEQNVINRLAVTWQQAEAKVAAHR